MPAYYVIIRQPSPVLLLNAACLRSTLARNQKNGIKNNGIEKKEKNKFFESVLISTSDSIPC